MTGRKWLNGGWVDLRPSELDPETNYHWAMESPDWSSLMTSVLRSLTRAEEELRLLHTNDSGKRYLAKGHLMVARHTLKLLEDWCDETKVSG